MELAAGDDDVLRRTVKRFFRSPVAGPSSQHCGAAAGCMETVMVRRKLMNAALVAAALLPFGLISCSDDSPPGGAGGSGGSGGSGGTGGTGAAPSDAGKADASTDGPAADTGGADRIPDTGPM